MYYNNEQKTDMIQQLIGLIFRRRHFWRRLSFDEIAELYVSRLLTIFAVNVMNLFAAVYLWKLGYGLDFIALFYAGVYLSKFPVALLAGKYTAYYGPKHAVLLGNLVRIPSLICFALAPELGLPAVIAFGLLQGASVVLYNIGYTVNFSKVRNVEHSGRELGFMAIIEKLARVASPLIGGAVAALWSPTGAIILASVLFTLSAWPLMRTVEPTALRGKFSLKGFPWRLAKPTLIAETGVGIDFVVSGMVWSMFMATVIFAGIGNAIYAAIGGLASLGVAVSVIASWTYGKLIDKNRAGGLIILGSVGNAVIHGFRPFVNSFAGVLGVNISSETVTSAYAMSLMRETFDVADTSGFRIAYLTLVEIFMNLGAFLTCVLWFVSIYYFGPEAAFGAMFLAGSAGVLVLMFALKTVRGK